MTLAKGWLKKSIDESSALVATWPDGMRGYSDKDITDDALLGGIEYLKRRLTELETEAGWRGLWGRQDSD